MATKKETRLPADFYILDTRTRRTEDSVTGSNPGRQFAVTNFELNADYAELKAKEKIRSLATDPLVTSAGIPQRVARLAANLHEMSHMTKEVFEYETEADGRLWIPKDKKEDAIRVFKMLYWHDNLIELEPLGAQFETKAIKEDLDKRYIEAKKR
jgi:hypothetical protein